MDDFKQLLLTNIKHCLECCHSFKKGVGGDTLTNFSYGTAGFRGNSDKIVSIVHKVGFIAGLRCLHERANIGVMITASHNPIQDNGVKLIDSNGQMLTFDWEPIVERFCNLNEDPNIIYSELLNLIEKFHIDKLDTNCKPNVFLGHDTRPSSELCVKLMLCGLNVWSDHVRIINYGLVTTPALHYLVAESNKQKCQMNITDYYLKLIDGLESFFNIPKPIKKYYNPNELIVDCANGVGFETMKFLCNNSTFRKCLPLELINTGDGILNKNCGADFVKSSLEPPSGANKLLHRYAALDGDADRLIYFYLDLEDGHQKLRLLDGDKIMALYTAYLKDVLKRANLDNELSLGVVQTAYANGASTDYLAQQLGIVVDCVDTGVKNLHRKALDYDIAVYFEANGHGTIWISDKARHTISQANGEAGIELRRLIEILNNYTGDAISDILIVESILNYYDMNIESWYKFYEDRPNILTKVHIKDRRLIRTTNAGRTCLEPVGLQDKIDCLVNQFSPQARSFVRASGTEDVIRIYAEAKTRESAEKLAELVGQQVVQMCNV